MRKKLVYIDSLRVMATLAVVLLHICTTATVSPSQGQDQILLYAGISAAMRWAVPVFVMISGALLLDPDKNFSLKRYAAKMIFVLLVFGWGYAILEQFYQVRKISFGLFMYALGNVFQEKSWDHMWYIYMLLGLYFLTPMLKIFTAHANKYQMRNLLLVMGCCSCLIPTINQFSKFFGIQISISNLHFSLPYVFLYLLGWYMENYGNEKQQVYLGFAAISALLSLSLDILLEIFYVTKHGSLFGWLGRQENLLNIAAAAAIFYLAKHLCNFHFIEKCFGKYILRCSFGIYLLHPFFINIIYKILHITPLQFHPFLSIPLFTVSILSLSILLTRILQRIPGLKKLVI